MANNATLMIKILSDASGAASGFGKAETATERWQQRTTKAAAIAAVALAAVGVATIKCVQAAASQEQAFGALEAVFKDGAGAMQEWAKQQYAIGLSAREAADSAAYLGSMLKGAGFETAQAAAESQKLVALGADLAATYGGTASEAVQALAATMRGEFDPIERFGVSIKQVDVNARLAEQGMSGLTGEALKQAEKTALLSLIWEKTADAQGQAGREAETTSARYQRFKATVENVMASIGSGLLPAVEALGAVMQFLADVAARHPAIFSALVAAFSALAVAVIAANVALRIHNSQLLAVITNAQTWAKAIYTVELAMALLKDTTIAATAAARAQLLAYAFTPVGAAILAVVAAMGLLVGAFVLLYNNSQAVRDAVTQVWTELQKIVTEVIAIIRPAIEELWRTIDKVFADIRATIEPTVREYWPKLKEAITSVAQTVNELATEFGPLLEMLGPQLAVAAGIAVVAVVAFAQSAAAAIRVFAAVLRQWWDGVKLIFALNKQAIDLVSGAYRSMQETASKVWAAVKGAVSGAWDRISDIFGNLRDGTKGVRDAFGSMADKISGAFQTALRIVQGVWNSIRGIIDNIRNAISSIDLNPLNAPAPAPAGMYGLGSGAGLGAVYGRSSPGGAPIIIRQTPIEINVTGTMLDPEGVARELTEVLNRHHEIRGAL